MAVPFGFSAGDFIAALEVVSTIIDALRDSGQASHEFRELLGLLYSLETSLLQVKRLEVDESQYSEPVALRQAAARCLQTIDHYWSKMQKYQPHLASTLTSFRLKTNWMKVEWALCKKDDVVKFKADLIGHTESIQILLATLQMNKIDLHEDRHKEQNHTLVGRIQDSYQSSMQKLSTMADSIASTVAQGKQLLELMAQIARTNVQVFAIVLDVQNIIKHIPGQVLRQQPVTLIDAVGRHCPFHLEFIRSSEALIGVLAANLSKYGTASERIKRNEFVIQDMSTKRDIDLGQDWELCFLPGQRVDMSIVFVGSFLLETSCPKCRWVCPTAGDMETESYSLLVLSCAWVLNLIVYHSTQCGMIFQRVKSIESDQPVDDFGASSELSTQQDRSSLKQTKEQRLRKWKRSRSDDGTNEIGLFRKFRLRSQGIRIRFMYWSIPEQQKFLALVEHFGTDRQSVADFMKTKTMTMVENYYARSIVNGKHPEMERIAEEADNRRKTGISMSPPPSPILPPERRFEWMGAVHRKPFEPEATASNLSAPEWTDSESDLASESQVRTRAQKKRKKEKRPRFKGSPGDAVVMTDLQPYSREIALEAGVFQL